MVPEILTSLRAATAADHARVESFVAIEHRLAEAGRYRDLLAAFAGYYEPLESALAAVDWTGSGLNFAERRKGAWLRADLLELGGEASTLPASAEGHPMPDLPSAFGALYVLEGATLGGQHVVRALAQSANPALPQRFFRSYGNDVGARWREFLQALQAQSTQPNAAPRIVRGARQTFAGLARWLEHTLPAAP